MTPSYLVHNVLLGNGVLASNITYSGYDSAIGFFNGVSSNLGLDSGLIITNGRAADACGPNNNSGTSYSWPNCDSAIDPDLRRLADTPVTSCAVIEFDFIPYSDTIKFKYVFGSEEYPEFVNQFNDAFGFFLSGPGISGPYSNNAKNIAILPDTMNTPVTIDSVNCASHANYYVCNWPNTCGNNCPTSSSLPSTTVQYDGFTVPLTAISAVQCGQRYHIKIGVCNAEDCAYESGVFLEAGSFTTAGSTVSSGIVLNHNVSAGDTLFRGSCDSAAIYIEKGNANTADTVWVTTGGTAVPGTDYNPPPSRIILPVGLSGDTLHIHAYPSANNNTVEIILHMMQHLCNGLDTQNVTIFIRNPSPVSVPPDSVCQGSSASLLASGSLNYTWMPATGLSCTNCANPIASPTVTTTYTVTGIDMDGCTSSTTAIVTVESHPKAAFSYEAQSGSPTIIQFTDQSTDAYGLRSWAWRFGDTMNSTSQVQNPQFNYSDTGTYCPTMVVTNIKGCLDSVTNCLVIEPAINLYIPDAFTPNGDKKNETFGPIGTGMQSYSMYIFDRWGTLLFSTTNNQQWNGTANGVKVAEDVYIYRIIAIDNYNKSHTYVGKVTVIK
jgi:gliding motility-associated-like protein